ncbi:hypothetical protein PV703_15685 [Streptomyces sp. ME01-24h]|nr:hypothetical protein [Streptomyces sp. ME01-24h]
MSAVDSQQIRDLHAQGLTDVQIAEQVGLTRSSVTKRRNRLGLSPNHVASLPSLEDTYRHHTRADGDHLLWTGPLGGGLPVLNYRGRIYKPSRVAFTIRAGRQAQGYVRNNCGTPLCVAPNHVDDTAERQRLREQYRYLLGRTALGDTCGKGHDQAVEGRLEEDGSPYCAGCQRDAKRNQRARTEAAA